jgi:ribosome-associated protein
LRKQKQNGAINPPATASPTWLIALRAAESKKASGLRILDLREVTTFADYFIICTGTNVRQNQAIWDEVAQQMKKQAGELPANVEGYENGEWILGDYGDVIVHVFSEEKREYYQLERLWRDAKDVPVPPEAAA